MLRWKRGLARITLLNCRRIYSPIQYVSSDFYNLSRKTGQVQSMTLLPRHTFIVLSLSCGETVPLIPKRLYTHKHSDSHRTKGLMQGHRRHTWRDQPLTEGKYWTETSSRRFQYIISSTGPFSCSLRFSLVGRWGMAGWLTLHFFSSWDLHSPWCWHYMSCFHQWSWVLDYFMDKPDDFLKCRGAMQDS